MTPTQIPIPIAAAAANGSEEERQQEDRRQHSTKGEGATEKRSGQ
jgi:hypothetical protein